jgi:hypothetical protein
MKPWSVRHYPRFRVLLAKFESYLEGSATATVRIFSDAFEALPQPDSSDDAQLLRAAYFFAEIYCTAGRGNIAKGSANCFPDADCSNGNPSLSLSSRLTYLRSFPRALYCIRHRKRISKGPLAEAQRILLASGMFKMRTQKTNPQAAKRKAVSRRLDASISTRPQKLLWTRQTEIHFGLDRPLPSIREFSEDQMAALAQRVMAIILVRCFQRFRSFVRFAVEDIICGETTVEILIAYSKNGRLMQRIPLAPLCATCEAQFVSDFRRYIGQLGIDPMTRLTELAGLGCLGERGTKAREKYKRVLGRFRESIGVHDPRRSGFSMAPIRMILAHHPEVVNVCEELQESAIFSAESLKLFRKIIPTQTTDSAEILRRLAGWCSLKQLYHSYCRSWPIQLRLWAEINKLHFSNHLEAPVVNVPWASPEIISS